MVDNESQLGGEQVSIRRRMIGVWLAGLGGALLLGIVGGVVGFLTPPGSRVGRRQRTRVGPVQRFPKDAGKLVVVEGLPVWVLNSGSKLTAVSALCTHKGCMVRWNSKRRLLACPCHAGAFDQNGNVVEGLPEVPLRRYAVAAIDGVVFVGRRADDSDAQ